MVSVLLYVQHYNKTPSNGITNRIECNNLSDETNKFSV